MLQITPDTLAMIDAFKGLDRPSRETIVALCTVRSYPSSAVVVRHQEESTSTYFIVSGSVRAKVYTERGREIAYEDLFAGDMFGELSAIDTKHRSTHVVALEETTLITMQREHFLELIENYRPVMRATLAKIARVVRFLCDRVYEFGALDVNSRIRAELLRLAAGDVDDPRRAIVPRMPTHQELANRLATHREAVSRELSRLEKFGLTHKQGHSLVINNTDELAALIGDSPSAERGSR